MRKAIVLYLPVLHLGYLNFFSKNQDVNTVFVLDKSITNARSFQKDLRALPPNLAAKMVQELHYESTAYVVEASDISDRLSSFDHIIMPDEEICHEVANKYLKGKTVIFVTTFLRWESDSAKANKDVNCKQIVATGDMKKLIQNILKESNKSADQYRQVAAAVFKKGEFCISTHNKIVPSIYTYFYEGDPRSQFKKGIHIELSLALHAEAGLIAEAAKHKGIGLNGAEMLVTDFPCPPCAKLIAHSGIKKVYFMKGYAVLDGERILRDNDVEIVKIKTS